MRGLTLGLGCTLFIWRQSYKVAPSQIHRTKIQSHSMKRAQGACTLARPSLKDSSTIWNMKQPLNQPSTIQGWWTKSPKIIQLLLSS